MRIEGKTLEKPSVGGFASVAKKVSPIWTVLENAGKRDLQSKKEKSSVGTLLFNLIKEAISTASLHKKAELIKALINERNNGNISFYFENEKLQNLVEFKNFEYN